MNRLYLDIPNSFNIASYLDHEEVRRTFQTIIDVALKLELELVTRKAPSYFHNEAVRPDGAGGVFYAYHSRVSGNHDYCIKGGPLPDLWYFDAKGYSGWCALSQDEHLQRAGASYSLQAADQTIDKLRHKFLQDGFSRQKQDESELSSEIRVLDDFVFYPLQLDFDEVMKLNEFRQAEIIDSLVRLAEQHGQNIVIKRHPLCQSVATGRLLETIATHPNIHLSDASIHKLIPACRTVLVSNSGVGLQALIHGKPVYTMAASEYGHMTETVTSLDELAKAFTPAPDSQNERIRRQLGHLLNVYLVDTTDQSAVERRISEHIASLQSEQAIPDSKPNTPLSVLHRANKELGETIALLLMDFHNLEGDRRQQVSKILLRAAQNELHLNKIVRGTDYEFRKTLATQFIKNGHLKNASTVALKLLDERPDDCASQQIYSQILLRSGNKDESLRWARSAVQCDNSNADALVFLGRQLAVNGETEEAANLALEAVKLEPRHPMANWLIAKDSFHNGDIETALTASLTAIEEKPDNPNIKKLHNRILAALDEDDKNS